MKLIVGLGNPGEKYQKTRHNMGFMVIEQLLKDFEPVGKTIWNNDAKLKSDIAEFIWQPKHGQSEKIILAKPKTYMNNSGMAVYLFTTYYKLQPTDIWIVHDDIDLPLGAIKIRFGGSSAGHKGVTSIIEILGTDKFWRFRMGIKGQNDKIRIIKNVDDFVLGKFTGSEQGKVRELIKRGAKALAMGLEEGLSYTMNRFNTK